MAGNVEQLTKAKADTKLVREELAKAKKAGKQTVASDKPALEEAGLAKQTIAHLQAAFAEAFQN